MHASTRDYNPPASALDQSAELKTYGGFDIDFVFVYLSFVSKGYISLEDVKAWLAP
jgi:hypothetical protein